MLAIITQPVITQPVIIQPIVIPLVIETHQASYGQIHPVNTPSRLRANIFKQKNSIFLAHKYFLVAKMR